MPSLFFFPLESSQTLRLLGIYAYLYITSHTIHHSTSFDVWHTLCMLAMMYLTVVHLVEYSPIEDESLCMGSNLYWHLYENGWGRKYMCCDVCVQFLYETVDHSYAGREWILLDEWCALSYFVYVFLYDINLLLYIFLPAFPSFPCTCVCSLMYLTCVFIHFMHHLMHVFFIHIDMWRNYLLTFIYVHLYRTKETRWTVVRVS